jgi:hypothetical protein
VRVGSKLWPCLREAAEAELCRAGSYAASAGGFATGACRLAAGDMLLTPWQSPETLGFDLEWRVADRPTQQRSTRGVDTLRRRLAAVTADAGGSAGRERPARREPGHPVGHCGPVVRRSATTTSSVTPAQASSGGCPGLASLGATATDSCCGDRPCAGQCPVSAATVPGTSATGTLKPYHPSL